MQRAGTISRTVELLAPAADLSVARAAIDAGADAVYMGGPAFGARSRAGNSMAEVEQAVKYAHRYAAKCFLTLNTLVYEHEMEQALSLVRQAYEMGVDALIVQDMGLLEADLPPIELHASTQCHITTPEKARFLEKVGFKRLILGRELSIEEIRRIVASVKVPVETFIHGALCVSYSGRCYMSCHMNGRSGNRGECAQSCRLAYRLENASGKVLQKDRYLLSMKDFNAGPLLEELLDSGVSSLKIEGRLKDALYVKNVTAYYRRMIDALLEKRPGWCKSSQGKIYTDVVPDVEKTYHREYTSFNLSGERADWAVFGTPKATGERIGRIKTVKEYTPGRYSGLCLQIQVEDKRTSLENGDGLCYYDTAGILRGGSIEKVVGRDGDYLVYMQAPETDFGLPNPGNVLYRNRSAVFEKAWSAARVCRKIPISIEVDTDALKMRAMSASDKEGTYRITECEIPAAQVQDARNVETADAMLLRQVEKLGGTAYEADSLSCKGQRKIFVPASVLNECRRVLVAKLDSEREEVFRPKPVPLERDDNYPYPAREGEWLYIENVANSYAEQFYRKHGIESVQKAFELLSVQEQHKKGQLLMVCKHCIRHQLGQCLKKGKPAPDYAADLYLCYGKNKFALHFDCANCRMEVRSCEE